MMPFFNLFGMFFRIGFFTFGGGYAMLPLIFQGVQQFGFMSAQEFSRLVALSQVTPGPIAINAATYVGFNYAGFIGALFATLGVALPSFILMMLTVRFIDRFKESKAIDGILSGIRPATVALIFSAVIFLAKSSLINGPFLSLELINNVKEYVNWLPCLIFVCTIAISVRFKISPIKLTILAGVVGALIIR